MRCPAPPHDSRRLPRPSRSATDTGPVQVTLQEVRSELANIETRAVGSAVASDQQLRSNYTHKTTAESITATSDLGPQIEASSDRRVEPDEAVPVGQPNSRTKQHVGSLCAQ